MPKKSSIALLATLAAWLIAFILPGCSSVSLPSLPWSWSTPATQPNATAEALFDEGIKYFNDKRYTLAIDRFQKIKAEFPFSPQLVAAELKLAEAYYLNKQYPEAAAAFKEFQDLHPNNENIPFVLYHLGLVHFEQFTSNDRYQKVTEIARGYFEAVVKNHPNSPYAAPAKEKLAKCLEYLSEYEFNVATFYLNEKKYPAAIDRLEGILRRYGNTPIAIKALYYLGESYRLEKNNVKAALAYEALIQHYPQEPLAKTAQTQLSDLAKEKQDPLAMLLKKDGRPQLASPPLPAQVAASREQGGAEKEKELNLVAKKDVVYEEPGEGKGMFRRVLDTLNPFSSSDNKKENDGKKIETANDESPKKESNGFFGSLWRGINPLAGGEKTKVDNEQNPQLINRIDESLQQRGIDSKTQDVASRPPAADLPKIEDRAPPIADAKELLGKIDSSLKKEGKNIDELPPPPEPAPIFKASTAPGQKPVAQPASPTETKGLLTGIDEALKRKGMDPAKFETTVKSGAAGADNQGASRQTSTARTEKKIELAPKLPVEKGPLFLDNLDYQAQRFDKLTVPSGVEGEKAKQDQSSEPVVAAPPKGAEPRRELPQAVVKGPPQPAGEKPAETKVVEKKKSPDEEEEPKGTLEQLKEDIGRLRDLLNPFGW